MCGVKFFDEEESVELVKDVEAETGNGTVAKITAEEETKVLESWKASKAKE